MAGKIRVAFLIGDYPQEERLRREKVALSYSNNEIEVGIDRELMPNFAISGTYTFRRFVNFFENIGHLKVGSALRTTLASLIN